MSAWPPPPDLESLKELLATADVEGFLAQGAPADEYDAEAELVHTRLAGLTTTNLTADAILPILASIWTASFDLSSAELAERHAALLALAQQIARFFGPEAQPQVREQVRP